MWDHGRRQPPAPVGARPPRFAARALDEDPDAGVLIHCQQGRRRSAMVAYAVLRLRGHDPAEAARLVLESPRAGACSCRPTGRAWRTGSRDAGPAPAMIPRGVVDGQ